MDKLRTQKGIRLRGTAIKQRFAARRTAETGPVKKQARTVVDGQCTADPPAGLVAWAEHCRLADWHSRVGGAINTRGVVQILFACAEEQPVGMNVVVVSPPGQTL